MTGRRGKRDPFEGLDLASLNGTRAVVTGATNGLGLATARALARAGASVILPARDVELGRRRAEEFNAAEFGGDCSVVRLDLADLSSVRDCAASIEGPIDFLVNNAGLFPHTHSQTVDGFELGIGTNFLGPFALTNLLLAQVRRRIVCVASDAHKAARIDPDDLNYSDASWSPPRAYARSKLAVMLWGLELDRRLRTTGSPIETMLTTPGWVASNISNKPHLGLAHHIVRGGAELFANDVDAGAATTIYCLTQPIATGSYVGVDGIGALRGRPVLFGRSHAACDFGLAGRLWEAAEKLTGTEF
ncbi:SDR family NAD(P)-dependent oxidoreductase [Gordonia sp. L191]|uniref:SDR family NAD(P)-dependent oxidoreductase n=1 Tax=Gordonia sp. L191 TaxID=2982699 RepID=UPI0024BFB7E6|nr:SDR family NAD(P)-dependent oxidoreductase [Gordonia sp. L191]WHU46563.1 SDR family NAD(P)-dependent oxidoreductase [Gordonia sp. L191]